ncbi:MAG: adenylate/guanylate cyclase domain-containing protein [Elusimicrobiota bacterium]|nr:adenylate/guanylate cyclase domain-containing protein [Elusimicrobiota bacterium]
MINFKNIKLEKNTLRAFLIGAAVTLLFSLFSFFGVFKIFEYKTQDFRFFLRGEREASEKVKIICMGDESVNDKAMGRWPWRRRYHAILLNILSKYNPAMVMYDVLFTEKDNYPEDDQILAGQLKKLKTYFPMFCIIDEGEPEAITDPFQKMLLDKIAIPGHPLASFYNAVELVLPITRFSGAVAGSGYANAVPDRDGMTRRVALVINHDGKIYPHIAFIMAMNYLGVDNSDIEIHPGKFISIKKSDGGAFRIPVDERNQMLLNYPGGIERYNPMSFLEVIDTYRENPEAAKLKDVAGKALFVGLTATGTVDLRPTPFSPLFPMVGVVAATFANIVDRSFMRATAPWADFLIVFFIGMLITAFSPKFSPTQGAIFSAVVMAAWALISYILFVRLVIVPLFYPLSAGLFSYLGITIFRFATEEKEKKFIKSTFQRYVSSQVVDELIKNPEMLNMKGKKEWLSVFFSDIRGFTSMSENMEPEEVVKILNEYLTEMTEIIFKHQGTLDKFIGDAIMAIWGAPKYFPNHAELAVRCACEMQAKVKELCCRWESEGRKQIGIGMGINTGFVVVGNMGSASYSDYTVIGDNVNLAARLEENAPAGKILISEATYKEVKDIVEVKLLEPLSVKGKQKAVKVYEVLKIC